MSISPPIQERLGRKLHQSPAEKKYYLIQQEVRNQAPKSPNEQTNTDCHRHDKNAAQEQGHEKVVGHCRMGNE